MRSPQLLAAGPTSINMTPMIDVVFLLIIFFLVSSHLAKQENAVRLDLPEALSGLDDTSEGRMMIVNVLPDGQWQIGGRLVDRAGLLGAFQQGIAAEGALVRLKIRTDRTVPYRQLEPLLATAAAAGIGDILFSVYEDRRN